MGTVQDSPNFCSFRPRPSPLRPPTISEVPLGQCGGDLRVPDTQLGHGRGLLRPSPPAREALHAHVHCTAEETATRGGARHAAGSSGARAQQSALVTPRTPRGPGCQGARATGGTQGHARRAPLSRLMKPPAAQGSPAAAAAAGERGVRGPLKVPALQMAGEKGGAPCRPFTPATLPSSQAGPCPLSSSAGGCSLLPGPGWPPCPTFPPPPAPRAPGVGASVGRSLAAPSRCVTLGLAEAPFSCL